MGILDAIQGTKVYLDTNIWIYTLELNSLIALNQHPFYGMVLLAIM